VNTNEKNARGKTRGKKCILFKRLGFFGSDHWNVVPPPKPNVFT
jgi:hypothetical protein